MHATRYMTHAERCTKPGPVLCTCGCGCGCRGCDLAGPDLLPFKPASLGPAHSARSRLTRGDGLVSPNPTSSAYLYLNHITSCGSIWCIPSSRAEILHGIFPPYVPFFWFATFRFASSRFVTFGFVSFHLALGSRSVARGMFGTGSG
jgi:hypothetical protein